MRKGYTILFLIVFVAGYQHAQDLHFSGFTQTLAYSNPSYIAAETGARLSTTYRNQWPGLNQAFTTYGAAIILPADRLRSAFGLSLIHDNQAQGTILKTSIGGIYAYTVKISRLVDVAAGLGLSYNFRSINQNRLVFETDINGTGSVSDPINYENYRSGYGDFSLGFTVLYDEKIYSGISVNHITNPTEHQGSENLVSLSRRYSMHLGAVFPLSHRRNNNDIFIMPGILFQQQEQFQELLYGVNCLISPVLFGLWTRQDLKFHYDAIILNTGFSWQQYNLFYSYDVNVKSMKFFSAGMGAHEVTFLVNFQYNEKRKKRGAVKCPKI